MFTIHGMTRSDAVTIVTADYIHNPRDPKCDLRHLPRGVRRNFIHSSDEDRVYMSYQTLQLFRILSAAIEIAVRVPGCQ